MKLAYVLFEPGSNINQLLAELAARLLHQGFAVAGATQAMTPRAKGHRCDMDLQIWPDGHIVRISQNLGQASAGCQLDTSALEEAAMMTSARLEGADLLIVNKFGPHEASGSRLS